MDYLLIDAVNALRASSAVSAARANKIEQEMADAGIFPPPTKHQKSHRDSVGSMSSRIQAASADDKEDKGVRTRSEAIELHVGGSFVENSFSSYRIGFGSTRFSVLITSRQPLFDDSLGAIKLICKKLWKLVWISK